MLSGGNLVSNLTNVVSSQHSINNESEENLTTERSVSQVAYDYSPPKMREKLLTKSD